MIIAIELDGVVFNYTADWQQRWQHSFGIDIPFPDAGEPHEQVDMTRREFFRWYQNVGGYAGIPLMPDAAETLHTLSIDMGHSIVLVTDRPRYARVATCVNVMPLEHDGLLFINAYTDDDDLRLLDADLVVGPPTRISEVVDIVEDMTGEVTE